jgi:hypothetical protein
MTIVSTCVLTVIPGFFYELCCFLLALPPSNPFTPQGLGLGIVEVHVCGGKVRLIGETFYAVAFRLDGLDSFLRMFRAFESRRDNSFRMF